MNSHKTVVGHRRTIFIGTSLSQSPVSRHFSALGCELAKAGHNVTLLVHGPGQDRSYVNEQLSVLRWPSPRPTQLADMLFFNQLVVRSRPCCLISNFGATNVMMLVGALRRVPVRVHWYHTLSSQIDLDSPGSQRLRLFFLRLRARFVYKLVTHNVANSTVASLDLETTFGVPGEKCIVFANSLEDPLANGGVTADSTAPVVSSRFLCVGRFACSKGQDVVLRAMAEAVRHAPGISVEFAGDGPARQSCERLAEVLGIKNHCLFPGKVPHDEVLAKMRRACATLVPSRAEAFGLVNIESMAVGTPVIGSATGGIAEIVRDGVDGLLFEPGNDRALAACLLKLEANPALRTHLAAHCRQRFLEKYELGQAVRRQSDWLCHLIQGSQVLSAGEPGTDEHRV